DADKEGFLRSARSLTQTAGRAARNIDGKVIMYADTITNSMKVTIDETERRRRKQMSYNMINNIEPKQIEKKLRNILGRERDYSMPQGVTTVINDPLVTFMKPEQINEAIKSAREEMEKAASELDFMRAAQFRDQMIALKNLLEKKL
ncbi:MAG TPA: UvrB/UvrC motif-containing protein, partial [Bacteroidales bacterium]|nr:UvrB/UvrC motif-containing protein [Bacteroidales bacterium]